MKKIDEGRLEWLRRQQRLADEEALRLARARRHAKEGERVARSRRETTIVQVPQIIRAERAEDRRRLLQTLETIMTALHDGGRRVKLDFSKTTKMFPGGMLILLAYLELLLEDFPGRIRASCRPHSLAAQLMRHFGIADKMGLSPRLSQPKHESVVGWKYLTGQVTDGSSIAELLQSYRDMAQGSPPEGLYEALTEALINVRHHAYPTAAPVPPSLQRWWLFAKYEQPEGKKRGGLYIAVYDIGVGIPQSMRARLKPGEQILDAAEGWLDWIGLDGTARLERNLLQAAVERQRSSTGLAFRGNGLPEMREFVMGTPNGTMSIVSGLAQYTCLADGQKSSAVGIPDEIRGTLILWNIPFVPGEAVQ